VVFQLPYYSVVPFFLVGGGLLGVRSNALILGDDVDPALHYGGGVKVQLTKVIGLRVEARNIMSANSALENAGGANIQVMGGITFTLGRRPPPPPPEPPPPVDPDRDKDGFVNEKDDCPDVVGVAPHGCPDTDGDSFRDSEDACPEAPGVAPDGCPVKDTDNDGFLDPDDDCVFEPETKNDYKDGDGCPDELPPEVEVFQGTIEGIEFDTKKDTIRPVSRPVLDKAVEVLKKFTDIRVNIVGHTDDVGVPEFNLDLSRRRAEAVKKYLVDHGVDASRVTTEGRGMNEPRVPNDSDANRAKNRRIQFEVRSVEPPAAGTPGAAPSDGGAPTTPTTPAEPTTPSDPPK
jgi:outer membrane protein OmpA-like peptidoglycan-associated protein